MIKVGIIGGLNLHAEELLRILINHPDVELKWVRDRRAVGSRLDQVVPGIIGESDLIIEDLNEIDDVDLIYMCGNRSQVRVLMERLKVPEAVRVIDMSGVHNQEHGDDKPWVYGLNEMQRRIIVHDARMVTVPGNAAAASLLALIPMARNLLLNSPLTLHVAIGMSVLDDGNKTFDNMDLDAWARDQQQEVALALSQCQSSFSQPVTITVTPLAERRTLAVAARFKCGVDAQTIRQLYEQYYDDHNFVFIVDRPIVSADVENTNKCLIYLDKDEQQGELTIHAVMDVLLKGCAGSAVHSMNLLFGLHEKVGLALKATGC